MTTSTEKRITVHAEGAKAAFAKWIAERGGVQVWVNVNLSNPGAGEKFTPLRTEQGQTYDAPHWSVTRGELVTDITRFRFVKEQIEFKRVKIAVRVGRQGISLKLTDASTKRVYTACDKAKEKYGRGATFVFDDDTAIIQIPVYDDESVVDGRIVNS